MKLNFTTVAASFTIVGTNGEIIAQHSVKDVNTDIDLAALAANSADLIALVCTVAHKARDVVCQQVHESSLNHIAREAELDAAAKANARKE